MRCMTKRSIGRQIMPAMAAALVALTFLPSPATRAEPAQAPAPVYGMSVTPLKWTVRNADGSERTVEGVVARGVSMRSNVDGSIRPIRMVLMPVSDEGGRGQGNAGELKYGLFTSRTRAGEYVGLELHAGAALVDLAPQAGADHPIVAEAAELGSDSRSGQSGEGDSPRDIRLGFFPFWPMIITHALVAGAEGTRLLVVSTPKEGQTSSTTLVSLVEGRSAVIDWKDNPDDGVNLGARERLCITNTGDRHKSAQANNDQVRVMADTLEALKAGWAAAFPDERK